MSGKSKSVPFVQTVEKTGQYFTEKCNSNETMLECSVLTPTVTMGKAITPSLIVNIGRMILLVCHLFLPDLS